PGINEQWGDLTPFVLPSNDLFRPSPPPQVGSTQYLKALEEVRNIGSATSSTRSPEQVHIAQFYKQDAELLVNEAARLLSAKSRLPLEANALLFLLTDVAIADARIAVWEAKYTYKFWRPITALNADTDGVVRNNYASWSPFLVTPSHSSYPSGHSGTVNAGVDVLKAFFGNSVSLTLHTTTPGEPARTVRHLSQIEDENGLSRIYGGIHYSFDNFEGQKLGHKVAQYVLNAFLSGAEADDDAATEDDSAQP
ncbi:MAG: superfamily protein, partial [Verrucomicrobiales bacterium]|nr:superfamily protein [Verrucomicrobiales bacterium]